MKDVTYFLQHVSAFGFALVGLLAVITWLRDRSRGNAYLALALGLLGLVSLIGEIQRDLGVTQPDGTTNAPPVVAAVIGLITLGMFMGCGFALLLFRHYLLPFRRNVLAAVGVVMAATTFSFIPFTLQPSLLKSSPGLTLGLVILLLGVWSGSVGEPVYRLWRVSRSLPAVQRARLRALAAGYGIIIVVLLFAIGIASAAGRNGQADPGSPLSVALQLITLLAIPALYVSFAPPRWLRRSWRASEEEAFNEALHNLLLDSPTTGVLADRALSWAVRLVGAQGGLMVGATGAILARRDVPDELVDDMVAVPMSERPTPLKLPGGQATISVPLALAGGAGRMVVLAGTLTPALGNEESVRLSQYAVSVSAAIDRMVLVEAVRRSEEELRVINRDLELRVQSRTAELEFSNRELQASNRELEAFSYTVSHDLRSPLRAIDGFTRILTEEHGEKLDADAARYLGLVAENARGMGSLIDTMLTFSRMGRQALTLQKVEPTQVAQRVAERTRVDTAGRSVDIKIDPLPEMQSDPVLVEQLFGNLIGNAVKFTRQREKAVIEVGAMPDPQAPQVTAYYVRDNGIGFDPRYAHKLFGVFQRLHRSEEYEGFGAGLAIVERIVTRHGGRVWAESVPGEGATFYFTLQADPAGPQRAATADAPGTEPAGGTVKATERDS